MADFVSARVFWFRRRRLSYIKTRRFDFECLKSECKVALPQWVMAGPAARRSVSAFKYFNGLLYLIRFESQQVRSPWIYCRLQFAVLAESVLYSSFERLSVLFVIQGVWLVFLSKKFGRPGFIQNVLFENLKILRIFLAATCQITARILKICFLEGRKFACSPRTTASHRT